MTRKQTVVRQYFYVRDTFLKPAYQAKGRKKKELLRQSIKAHTQLIDWFQSKKHMPTACAAQYLIAEAYQKLGESTFAKQAYQQVLSYRQYVRSQPQDKGEMEILVIIATAEKRLEELP